jgi:MraZ protein
MNLFRGLQTGRVDEKGRLKFSALVKQQIESQYEESRLFITSLDGEQVKIFPIKEWEAVEARLSQKSTEGKEVVDGEVKDKILFHANRYGAEESLDNQGRILVPAVLRETAGMRGEVKMTWQSNHILVLSAKKFEETAVEKRLTSEDLKHAANLGV